MEGVQIELHDVDDIMVKDWFYESGTSKPLSDKCHYDDTAADNLVWVNGSSYKKWRIGTPIMANLYRLSSPETSTILMMIGIKQ